MPAKRATPRNRTVTGDTTYDDTIYPSPDDSVTFGEAGSFTGRYLVLMKEDDTSANLKKLQNSSGLTIAASSDFNESQDFHNSGYGEEGGIFLEEIGVAIVNAAPESLSGISAAVADTAQPEVMAMEPERICATTGNTGLLAALKAFSAGAQAAYEHALVASGGEIGRAHV